MAIFLSFANETNLLENAPYKSLEFPNHTTLTKCVRIHSNTSEPKFPISSFSWTDCCCCWLRLFEPQCPRQSP